MEPWDALIVGAGPAGLSTALLLGRCRRRALVLDDGRPRNAATRALHGFLTRDGVEPGELRRLAAGELARYPDIVSRPACASRARRLADGFEVETTDGVIERGRVLVLATGKRDQLPDVEGLPAAYGRTVFHCPACDAWEFRDMPMAAYAPASRPGLALELLAWSPDVVLCTDGTDDFEPGEEARLRAHGVGIQRSAIARLEVLDGCLQAIVFQDGLRLPRAVLFFATGQDQQSDLACQLGCAPAPSESAATDKRQETSVPGLFIIGDASRGEQLAIVAAAEGAKAALAIHALLQRQALLERQDLAARAR